VPALFVAISGLPGSGKTTLARRLAAALNLPLIDKDDILERLFDLKGTGDSAWRRALSRESDEIFQQQAMASGGCVLVSFWHQPGMPEDSGTPTAWLGATAGRLINVHCVCSPEEAAERFLARQRHPGHLDSANSYEAALAGLRSLACLALPDLGRRIDIDTTRETGLLALIEEILPLET